MERKPEQGNVEKGFTRGELFDYIDRVLPEERAKQLESELAVDKELEARLSFVRDLVERFEAEEGASDA